jgi:hypothetical protein
MATCRTAKVVVHLRNDRESPYEHDKFGDEIIVERAINKSGPTTVKLMDKNHRVVYNVCTDHCKGRYGPMNTHGEPLFERGLPCA